MFWENLISLFSLNLINIVLFFIFITLVYVIIKPLIKKWIEKRSISTISYFVTIAIVSMIVIIYSHIMNGHIVTNSESIKNLVVSLWIAFILVGIAIMFKLIAQSLTQFIKNKNI